MSEADGVQVKLGGALVEYAPTEQPGNKHVMQLEKATSVQDVLDQLAIPAEQPLMVIVNDSMVARPDYSSTLLVNGDALALMPPIKAG